MKQILTYLLFFVSLNTFAQTMINIENRLTTSLNGKWNIIIDPYENGYYDYRYEPHAEGYFKNAIEKNESELLEYSFDTDEMLYVPGDWNSQMEKLLFYEGTVWYKNSFDYDLSSAKRLFIHFGAVNYDAKVYLNGEMLGHHEGGFTPFQYEITDKIKAKGNFVVVKVDNKRLQDAVPTVNTDWYNYGGITRPVTLIETEKTFISEYSIQLKKGDKGTIAGKIKLDGSSKKQKITVTIDEASITKEVETDNNGIVEFEINAELVLWSPNSPKLYQVKIESETDMITDKIGFRTIETRGTDILLNGKTIYLKGISIHEEAAYQNGARAFSKDHAKVLLGWAKELSCNYVRLAHYTHNEAMVKMADELGLLVWAEIPVYWTISWEKEATYKNAENQLATMINRDKNRASIILWSMANETPVSEPRFHFLSDLVSTARELDPSRLITAAMERHYTDDKTLLIDDPFGELVDVLGCNAYIGWYDGLPEKCADIKWETIYNKPVVISEFGGGAMFGNHGDKLERWTEEYQEDLYIENIKMFEKVDFIKGMTPWILKDFKSPRRHQPRIQNFWNVKGLVTDKGDKKKAFYVLKEFYDSISNE
ncbi:MAG: beta-glucuronidase [Melioribacteraceae bacterium]|nr:beta-glucuronidase [Melioribacteraceae bacterium]MCF8266034.1 beta-glucuronidase [Melioribacteraceae bacterium]MCF8431567.1 beta-glucuronidase [Melioribacteraceae bacterium]